MSTLKVIVVGGGIAGLAAAHRFIEQSRGQGPAVEVTLLEAKNRLGGTIATERVDGFFIEAGPDSFLSEKPWALALAQRLGLGGQLVGTNDRYRRTFVVHRGQLHPLPDGFQLLAPTQFWSLATSRLFSWPGKLRMAMDLLLPRGHHTQDESLAAFVTRRLGREALDRVAQPLVAGIYTADPEQLSVAATMPRFLEMERRDRSVILALWRSARRRPGSHAGGGGPRWSLFVTLRNGMVELVHALSDRLPPGSVQLRSPVKTLRRADQRWRVITTDGSAFEADGVVLATEAHQTARIVAECDSALAALLKGIPYASSATVSLGYRREDVRHPLDGFGFVVPRIEARPILACTFSSVKYPHRAPAGHVLLRLFFGGAFQESILKRDDSEMIATGRAELESLLGIRAEPVIARVYRYPVSMPQYLLGHLDQIAAIEARLQHHGGLKVAGSAYRGVGIADCVRSGEDAADQVLQALRLSRAG
jgi:oxygen-dependent protoporphyrinogen oxidase